MAKNSLLSFSILALMIVLTLNVSADHEELSSSIKPEPVEEHPFIKQQGSGSKNIWTDNVE